MNARDKLLWLIDLFDEGRIEPATFVAEYHQTWTQDLDVRQVSAHVWSELAKIFHAASWYDLEGDSCEVGAVGERGLRQAVRAGRAQLPNSGPLERPDSREVPRLENMLNFRSTTEMKRVELFDLNSE